MCSENINKFISCHTHPPRGSPYCGKDDLFTVMLATFLFQMCHQNFTFFFSSSSRLLFQFPIQKLGRFSSSLSATTPHTTTLGEKGPKWKNRKNATDTHTHTAAAERALLFNMFCETLAGAGKMEIEKNGNGKTQRKR